MVSTTLDWNQLLYSLIYATPQLLCYGAAIFFCITKRRENPKGATYLGIAALVSAVSTIVSYSLPFLITVSSSSYLMGYVGYLMLGFHAVSSIIFWALIIAAVFARPAHYDPRDASMFDE